MRAARLLVGLLVLAMLAGCVTPPATEPAPSTPALSSPAPIAWTMANCHFGVALTAVPAAAVQPFVPEGFRIQSVAEAGAEGQVGQDVPNPQDDGNIGFEVFRCEKGSTLDGQMDGMVYASVFTGVEPPADLRRDVQNHFVKWDVLIPDDARREVLVAAGIAAHAGQATAATEILGASMTSYEGSATIEGLGAFAFSGRSVAPLPDGAFTEYTETPNGLVEWTMRYHLVSGGAGPQTVTIPDGAWFNEIIPAGTHEGFGFSGIIDFEEGSIAFPTAGNASAAARAAP